MENTDGTADIPKRIKAHLISEGLKPGDKIDSESVLAERFGVTRHHVRQALASLVQAGILERAPRRGTVIRDFDANSLSEHIRFQFELAQFDVSEFREARAVIESAILPLAVRRITPSQIGRVRQTIVDMLANADNPELADSFDRDFHVLLLEASGNQVLKAFSGVLTTLFRNASYRKKYWNKGVIERIAREHTTLLDAIEKGDTQAAMAALDAHLRSSRPAEEKKTD